MANINVGKTLDKKALKKAERIKEKNKLITQRYGFNALSSTARGGLIPIIFLFLCIAGLGSLLSGSSNLPTFESFLLHLEDVPEIQMPFINFYQLQVADWGFFNFIRWVLDAMLSLLNIAVFIGNGVLSVLTFIIYFISWLVGF